ncbi:MAG: thioredoxin family protein [Prevotellaceae bacterium]|nr:thioredoxin family protein [Prevotellaceae bacterium]
MRKILVVILFSFIFLYACGVSKQNIGQNDFDSISSKSTFQHFATEEDKNEALFSHIDSCMATIPQQHDSVIVAIDGLLDRFQNDTMNLRLAARHLYNIYLMSEMLGAENITVHIADNYYLNNKVMNESVEFIAEVADYAKKFRATLIGKKAENLKMETITGSFESLYDIDSPFILVYFFDPGCRHCYLETPKIYRVFCKYKDTGLAGYCVYSQSNKEEWINYVAKNRFVEWTNVWDPTNENNFRKKYSLYTIPQAYLLDRDKNIIGRRLDETSLSLLLDGLLNKNK